MSERLDVRCDWCEEEASFQDEEEWRTSGWMIHLTDEGSQEYCSVGCCISAMS